MSLHTWLIGDCKCAALQAEHKLVVLEIESSKTCDSGLSEEAEVHWEEDKKLKLARCSNLKHTFQRTARDCPDVKFLMLEVCCPSACPSCAHRLSRLTAA